MNNDNTPITLLITGASQGIGAAIAEVFSQALNNTRLILVARNAGKLAAVKASCNQDNNIFTYACDVSDADAVASLHEKIVTDIGHPDVLINNAGEWHGESVVDTSPESFDHIIASNLRSTFLMCHYFLPGMLKKGAGDIFNMASTAGFEGYANVSAYCAAKHGVIGFSKALREEVRGKDIRVSCISPGATWSPSWQETGIDKSQLMSAEQIANAFLNIYQMDRNVVVEDIVLRPAAGHISSD